MTDLLAFPCGTGARAGSEVSRASAIPPNPLEWVMVMRQQRKRFAASTRARRLPPTGSPDALMLPGGKACGLGGLVRRR